LQEHPSRRWAMDCLALKWEGGKMIINLLEETIEILKEYGKTPEDILWCGSPEWGWFKWEDFEKLANKKYDSGFGSPHVASDLLIVGRNFWLERHEYDGSEWWEFKQIPPKPKEYKVPRVIVSDEIMWDSLKEANEDEEE